MNLAIPVGHVPQNITTRRKFAVGSLALLSFTCAGARAESVEAGHYDAFFLWAGVHPSPELAHARELFLLAAEVRLTAHAGLISQRAAIPKLDNVPVWVALRVETLEWTENIYSGVLQILKSWRAAGNTVVGLQLDFDSGTKRLEHYGAFLADLRARLPAEFKLGITGLLDWSGNAAGLAALKGVVDEVVLQIYQGRRVIANYQTYVSRLAQMPVPFRIGLLQGGEWHDPVGLRDNPNFKGFVVFLANQRGQG